jgi:rhamnosyltransferase
LIKVSVIIPVKNGESTLSSCLDSIISQTIVENIEIIILDSGSNDKSVSIAESFGAKVIHIEPSQFNHGLTRNLGIQNANGDLLFFTVQDAELSSTCQLANMTAHFNDHEVQAVVGIQGYPSDLDKNPALWFKRFDEPKIEKRHFPNGEFEELSKQEQFDISNWDNVNAMYRKSVLLELPFPDTNFSEDWMWANIALKSGKKILRDPSLLVWHYHHMTFGYTLKSKFIINYYFKIYFKNIPNIPFSFIPILKRSYTLILKRRNLSNRIKIYWILHNLSFFLANFLSIVLFRIFDSFSGQRGLDFLYTILCKKTPQGKIKKMDRYG